MSDTCKHQRITTFVFEDTREPSGLWACADCGHKFVQIDLEMEQDAARYRWLKNCKGPMLKSEPQPNVWKRSDGIEFSVTHLLIAEGTQYATAESLDDMIDAAMIRPVDGQREKS